MKPDFQHFLDAQSSTYAQARMELASGQKRTHWMWFVFPQIAGLGSSHMAKRYAIRNLHEAEAYLQHPVLGPRLRDCTSLVLAVHGRTLQQIFGTPDDLKFHSSISLFAHAAPHDPIFKAALLRFFDGVPDPATLSRLKSPQDAN